MTGLVAPAGGGRFLSREERRQEAFGECRKVEKELRREERTLRQAEADRAHLATLVQSLVSQEPYLEFNRDSWDKEFERAQIQVKFTEVLESLHPVALQERAAALVEHFAGELAEWEREHEALEQHHKQMVYVIRRAKEVLQQLEGDCRERVARIKTLKKLREFQKQKYSIVTQFAW